MRLLVTRPEPDNERTAAALRARGHDVLLAPLLRIETVTEADLGAPGWAALLLTSANAARAIAHHPGREALLVLPVLAVGRATAEAARAAGFADVASADGDAADLARSTASRFAGSGQPLLYLAGEDRSGDLTGELAARGVAVTTVVIYRAAKAAHFPPAAYAALEQNQIDGVVHFSRRSLDAYMDCSRELMRQALAPAHYCLSARTAEPLRQAGAARIEIAAKPDETSLLALIAP